MDTQKDKMSSRKLLKFLILFDNSNLLFFPGQYLSGRVILEVDDDMPVLGKISKIIRKYYFLGHNFFPKLRKLI